MAPARESISEIISGAKQAEASSLVVSKSRRRAPQPRLALRDGDALARPHRI